GFLVYCSVQYERCLPGQYGLQVTHHGDERIAKIADKAEKHFYFRALPAFADDEHDVMFLHHTQVAMDGVGSVKKNGRRPGGVEGRHDLLCDDGALPDTAD